MLCKPSENAIQSGTRIDDLPFQVEVHKVKFPHVDAVDSFQTLFCQALSLVCDSPVKIFIGFYSLEDDKSFNLPHGGGSMRNRGNRLGTPIEAGGSDIEQAKCLYQKLVDLDADDREKLQIAIDRWIMSKTDRSRVDRMIDLGKALEALYVTREDRISNQFCHRASWYLGENPVHQQELETELEAIYDYRSAGLHNREVGEDVQVGDQSVPISDLVIKTQNLCRKSILQIIKDGQFPNWNTLRQRAKAKWASS